jgi:uncharacterized protein
MIDAAAHGAPTWADLSTPDLPDAEAFYTALFGWSLEHADTPTGSYVIADVGGHQVAGLMHQEPDQLGAAAVWTVSFLVADIDAALVAAERAGGSVLQPPISIPSGARMAVVADPSGAVMGLITGPHPGGAWCSDANGSVCWVELLTRDPLAAEPFYLEVLGWKSDLAPTTSPAYTVFRLDGDECAGMLLMPDQVPARVPSYWNVHFAVDDCESVVARTVVLGGQVLQPMMDLPMGRFAVLEDRQGAVFCVLETR